MTRTTSRRDLLKSSAVVTAASLGFATGAAASGDGETDRGIRVQESFEGPSRTWMVESDVGSENPPYSVGLVDDAAASGGQCVEFELDATRTLGTTWIRSEVDVDPDTEYEGEFSLSAWSPTETGIDPAYLRVYVGPDVPERTADFPTDEDSFRYYDDFAGLDEPLYKTAGWSTFDREFALQAPGTDVLQLVVGITTNWEARMVNRVDDVDLSLTPK